LNEFRRIRNLVRKESRSITNKKQKDIAQACKSNPKKFWQHVRSKTASSNSIGDIKVTNGGSTKIISLDSEKPSFF